MAIVRRKSKTKGVRYMVRMHLGDGEYETVGTYPTRGEAKEAEAKWLLSKGRGAPRKKGGEWAKSFLADYKQRRKASSYVHARSAINRWLETFGNRTLSTITEEQAQTWTREHSWASQPVCTMMNAAVRAKVAEENYFKGRIRTPGRKHNVPLSVDDIERLGQAAEEQHGKYGKNTLRPFVLFAAYSGMRVGEMFALKWEDIDFERNRIHVRRRFYGKDLDLPKSNKPRAVVLLPEAADALSGLDRGTEWVFLNKSGEHLSKSSLAYYWQKVSTAFGKPVQPHELKHFTGHHLFVTCGMPERIVAEQLGHTDGGKLVRELYGHGDHEALEEIERRYAEFPNVVPLKRASNG